jgi:hypothetical protein
MNSAAETTARNILRDLYTETFQLRRLVSQNKELFVAEFLNGDEPVILKMPRQPNLEFTREQKISDELETAGLPIPPIYFTQENRPFGDIAYTVQKYVQGPNLAQVIEWNDDRTDMIFNNIGQLAAQLSAVPFSSVPDALLAETTQAHELQWWEDYMGLINRHRGTTPLIWQLYHAARGIMLVPPVHFGHRDGVQVVTDTSSIFLVDVGSSGANWPDADFARLLYGGIVWHNGQRFPTWHKAAQAAYFAGRTVSDADVERIVILMVYYALRDAAKAVQEGKSTRVDQLYQYANHFITDVRTWFNR